MVALKNLIGEKLGKAITVSAEAGRTTSFEVSVNGNSIYSKLKEKAFPDFDDVVKALGEFMSSGKLRQAVKKA